MRRSLLIQSVMGHLALLAEKYPRKAASPVARRARKAVNLCIRPHQSRRLAA